ncbi:hypothetical protein LS684_05710 [Cytobacillus spongiae]|jgi:hypothetical protein|uniref:hypothetical protein n=1 Tax=Cytobacillus spongiae TaxID=2901381 RepID=UPI001F1A9964|nr:hypothetical protein [Cytobacillus spongiae]UII56934.1 hypothetical protein LS684_05710 [Cytobacillus spongiae]
MSLIEVHLSDIVKKQYFFKLKGFVGAITSLLIAQLFALLFSLGGLMSLSTGSGDGTSVTISSYSANLVIAFTMIWGFVSAFTITTRAYRNDDFTFVSTRLSSNLANILYIVSLSMIGGFTSLLSGIGLKVFIFYQQGADQIIGSPFSPLDIIVGLLSTSLYVFLISALGYLLGVIIQLHKLFAIVLSSLLIGLLIVGENFPILQLVLEFFYLETSLFQFTLKVLFTSGLLFVSAISISNHLEVK